MSFGAGREGRGVDEERLVAVEKPSGGDEGYDERSSDYADYGGERGEEAHVDEILVGVIGFGAFAEEMYSMEQARMR